MASTCAHTLAYADMRIGVDIRRERSKYADIRQCTLFYTRRSTYILDMFTIV